MTSADLRFRMEALRWYHTIDLGRGIITQGVDDTPLRLARLDLPSSLEGRSVLDIGAWDGFFSFEAERRGASRVVAVDYYARAQISRWAARTHRCRGGVCWSSRAPETGATT